MIACLLADEKVDGDKQVVNFAWINDEFYNLSNFILYIGAWERPIEEHISRHHFHVHLQPV